MPTQLNMVRIMNGLKVEKSNKTENINDLKIFLLCISSGVIGFSLIGILPYEIPLFLRVSIAFLFLGIPLLEPKKIILFGIAGGLGFFIKDYIFWDLFSLKWTSAYGNTEDISLLTGLMIGAFLSIALWNRKAIGIFPLTGALAFSGFLENLPERLRTKDFAVVWEIWTGRGIEYVIWRTK